MDCDDLDSEVINSIEEDADCDLIPTEIDCDDGSRCIYDNDCKSGRVCEKENNDTIYKTYGISVDC